jgi:hypothetical protein
MQETKIGQMKEAHGKQKGLLDKVLASPKPYLDDVRSLMREIWHTERQIIAKTGTIHNGL